VSAHERNGRRNTYLALLGALAVLGALAIWTIRRWTRHSMHEAATNVAGIARSAAAAYLRDQPDGTHRLCPSMRHPVPADRPHNEYRSRSEEWNDAGFACLRFEVTSPQYCQYGYEADATAFVAWGRCDPDENGVLSEYRMHGRVVGDEVKLDGLEVTNEGE
jgi:type II secretory pathway pseudopilin PulG